MRKSIGLHIDVGRSGWRVQDAQDTPFPPAQVMVARGQVDPPTGTAGGRPALVWSVPPAAGREALEQDRVDVGLGPASKRPQSEDVRCLDPACFLPDPDQAPPTNVQVPAMVLPVRAEDVLRHRVTNEVLGLRPLRPLPGGRPRRSAWATALSGSTKATR